MSPGISSYFYVEQFILKAVMLVTLSKYDNS